MPGGFRSELKSNQGNTFPWLLIAFDLLVIGFYIFFAIGNGIGQLDWSTVASSSYPIAAAIILFRQPKNRVGWALGVMGMLMISCPVVEEYAYYALVTRPGSLPFGAIASWASVWLWTLWEPLPILAILIFPNGDPPSPRWWRLIGAFVLGDLLVVAWSMVLLWPLRGALLLSDQSQSAFGPPGYTELFMLNLIWTIVFMIFIVLALIGIASRFKRARGVERQQLKWIILALIFVPISIGMSSFLLPSPNPWVLVIYYFINMTSVLGFPIAMMFAITRYHLYDINVIIRRTLLYGGLTIALGLIYFCTVILLETLLAKTGAENSQVSIIFSTLLIAGLFRPLRRRFQTLVDKRFYRQKYNSDQLLAHFTTELRTDIDPEDIQDHLLAIVNENLNPNYSIFWLKSRPDERKQR